MQYYQTKTNLIPGTSYKDVDKIALRIFRKIKAQTKRTPYIRSAYFNKEKVFLNIFWSHLHEKPQPDRFRRLKYFECSLDLMKNSVITPTTKINPNNKSEIFHRFMGKTKGGNIFKVQIKENIKTKRKDFISIVPLN